VVKKEESGLSKVDPASEPNGPTAEPLERRSVVVADLTPQPLECRRITSEARSSERRHRRLARAALDIPMTGRYVQFNRIANMCSNIEHFENRGVHGGTDDSRQTRITAFLKTS
jgi:hypothetical protein